MMVNINLLPPELKLKRIEAKRNASLIGICFVIVLIAIVLGVIGRAVQSTVTSYLDNSKNDIQKSHQSISEDSDLENLALAINDREKTATSLQKNQTYWSQVLQELANLTPTNMQYESVVASADKAPNFIIKGNTTTDVEIDSFKQKLEDSKYFKNVAIKSANINQGQDDVKKLSFTIEFDVEQKGAPASISGESS